MLAIFANRAAYEIQTVFFLLRSDKNKAAAGLEAGEGSSILLSQISHKKVQIAYT